MARESTVVKNIVKALRSDGALVWNNHGSAFSFIGIPDLMALNKGVFAGIEVKKSSEDKPTKAQMAWIRRIRKHGGFAGVARSVEDARQIFRGQELDQ